MASLTDVARAAGVSKATASRALSAAAHVAPSTRDRVLAAAAELGYVASSSAASLVTGRSRTIGVVTLRTNFYSRSALTYGIEGAAREAGYSVSAATTESLDTAAIEDALSHLADQGVEGVVLAVPLIHVSTRIEQLTSSMPTVTIDGSRTSTTEVIAVDQTLAARLATEHLLELGHETVWHVAGPREWLEASNRIEGWRDTLQQAGRTVPPELEGDWSPASGYHCGLVLSQVPDVTAVFVASDEMAFGVIRALHERNRRVPDDVSVVGVDDIALAEYCSPSLTTVAQPFTQMGALAVAHLLRQLADPQTAPEVTSVAPSLIVRASTAPVRWDAATRPAGPAASPR